MFQTPMYYFKTIILLTLAMSTSISAYAQHHQHKDHLSTMLEQYMEVKDALTKDDTSAAREHLKRLADEAKNNGEMSNHKKHDEMHADHHGQMMEALENAKKSNNIEEFRAAFKDISEHLAKAIENQEYEGDKELHLQYCPMANNNEGAYWLSFKEKIINPYMGQKMASCGIHKENIN